MRMIAKTLHDYDKGALLSMGAYMQASGKEDGAKLSFDKMLLSIDYSNCASDVRASIGLGKVETLQIIGDEVTREIGVQKQTLRQEKGSLDSVIHGSMIKDVTRICGLEKVLESTAAKEQRLAEEQAEKEKLLSNLETNLSKELADQIRSGKTRVIPRDSYKAF